MDINKYLEEYGKAAKEAMRILSVASSDLKNRGLELAAQKLLDNKEIIKKENRQDLTYAKEKGLSEAMLDRLRLDDKRIEDMAIGLRQIKELKDPIGETISGSIRPNGLEILKKRVPLGVIGIIYESRPNVTADAAGLCLKSGNACILRGGSEAIHSNICIANLFREALKEAGLPEACVSIIDKTDREIVNQLMKQNQYLDLLIPRGGKGLIRNVVNNATIPVIQTGDGICHLYVDSDCDLDMAKEIALNAKLQRPSVCNAIETLLLSKEKAKDFLDLARSDFEASKLELRCDERSYDLLKGYKYLKRASQDEWDIEYNDLILAVKICDSLQEAIDHINLHGTLHSEAIVTNSYERAKTFQNQVDASCVYVNSSTRFTDGFEFGLGAEIGISNQKLHARGPMGLYELTTIKYLINGNGQIRK